MVLAVVAAAPVLGACGDDDPPTGATGPQEIAERIRDNAKYYEQERERQATAGPEAPDLEPELPGDAELPPAASLPAGSAEIDGPTTPAQDDAQSSGGLLTDRDRSSFARLAAELPGAEGVAVAPLGRDGRVQRLGTLESGVAWSTAKVPVAMAAIAAGRGSDADLRQAITASDNAAAERLWTALGSGRAEAATAQLRAAGDRTTAIESERLRPGFTAFGQTDWSVADQARFAAGMACTAEGAQVLGLMDAVVAGQRWGLGSAGAADAQFKGGWGPGIVPGRADGWLDRQFGVLTIEGRPLAVAIATSAGSHEAGTGALTRLARWVADHVDVSGLPTRPRC